MRLQLLGIAGGASAVLPDPPPETSGGLLTCVLRFVSFFAVYKVYKIGVNYKPIQTFYRTNSSYDILVCAWMDAPQKITVCVY